MGNLPKAYLGVVIFWSKYQCSGVPVVVPLPVLIPIPVTVLERSQFVNLPTYLSVLHFGQSTAKKAEDYENSVSSHRIPEQVRREVSKQ